MVDFYVGNVGSTEINCLAKTAKSSASTSFIVCISLSHARQHRCWFATKEKKKERGICLHIGFLNDQTTNVKEDC